MAKSKARTPKQHGASFWKRMISIIIPLAKNGFISGFMLVFISIAKELDLIIIMMTPTTHTMSYLAFTYSQEGLQPDVRRDLGMRAVLHPALLHHRQQVRRGYRQELGLMVH